MSMRVKLPICLVLAALILVFAIGRNADAGAWCTYYRGGATHCGFYTLQQCQATSSGTALCYPNPAAEPPSYPNPEGSPAQPSNIRGSR